MFLFAQNGNDWRIPVVEAAQSLVLSNSTVANGVSYRRDCSGLVNAVFAKAGFPLQPLLNQYALPGLGGSQIMARVVQQHGQRDNPKTLQPGDLVFFDNTYDRNSNGKSDDPITHVGIVIHIDAATGEVRFIHYNTYMDKIVEQQFNFLEPANPNKNIILRWPQRNDPQQERYAGQLLNKVMGSPFPR